MKHAVSLFAGLGICMTTVSCRTLTGTGSSARRALVSHDTGLTIMKVRSAQARSGSFIAGASYEGTVLAMDYDGRELWTNPLSGLMVHDLWCDDLTGDGDDDVLVACANGYLYCLDGATGKQLWSFVPTAGVHKTPMYAACVVTDKDGTSYVACGGYDKNFYWLSTEGKLLKCVPSAAYSKEIPWGDAKTVGYGHTVNFLRPIPQPGGGEHLALCGTMSHMQSSGALYRILPLAETSYDRDSFGLRTCGEFRVVDPDGDGNVEFLAGTSELSGQWLVRMTPDSDKKDKIRLTELGVVGYRVSQPEVISDCGQAAYLVLCGTHIKLFPPDLDVERSETFAGTYAYNDMWKDADGRILLASAQSGGSCIHVLDPSVAGWKDAFQQLDPPGKIPAIKANIATAWAQIKSYTPPDWLRAPIPVYIPGANHPVAEEIAAKYDSPVFMGGYWHRGFVEKTDWRHQPETYIANEKYRERKDPRNKYTLTQQEVLDRMLPKFKGQKAVDFWAGHGNGPLYYSPETLRKVMEGCRPAKAMLTWPELENHDDDFRWVVENVFYKLAGYCAENNAWMAFKNKDIFWSSSPYLPLWRRMLSGEFADVFCSSMEETTDKTQDISIAGRLGLWAAGSMNQWGSRTSRDNPSFDRSRQHSYQRLPNHFLRATMYNLACGSTYNGTTYVNAEHFSILWPLLAKGALFVPKREEIVSFSPVHLSMVNPDERYMHEGKSKKWTVMYDEAAENANPMVFSHMNGSWPGAGLSPWDYSRYASGLKDRRQNFLPPFPNGIVLITPAQHGKFADPDAPRGRMTDHLHPLYKDIMKEHITNGRHYISADGTKTFRADEYYKTVAADIQTAAKRLPLTVTGQDVAWVCAQTAPKRLRLTLIDGGYINPRDRTAKVQFHTVKPVRMTDVLTGETMKGTAIDVPLGLFRFIDIELQQEFWEKR